MVSHPVVVMVPVASLPVGHKLCMQAVTSCAFCCRSRTWPAQRAPRNPALPLKGLTRWSLRSAGLWAPVIEKRQNEEDNEVGEYEIWKRWKERRVTTIPTWDVKRRRKWRQEKTRTGIDRSWNSELRRHGSRSIVRIRVTLCGCWGRACHTWWTSDGRGWLDWQSVMRSRTEDEQAGWLGMDRGLMTHPSICDPQTLMSVSLVLPGDANKQQPAAKMARHFVRALSVFARIPVMQRYFAVCPFTLTARPSVSSVTGFNCSFCDCLFQSNGKKHAK